MKGPVSFIGKEFTKELVNEYLAYDPETGAFARGYFGDPKVAHQAYLTAKRKLHTSCTI